MKMEKQWLKIFGTQQKQEGSLQCYKPTSRNNKSEIKHLNLKQVEKE